MKDGIKFIASREGFSNHVNISAGIEEDGFLQVVKPVEFRRIEKGYVVEPMFQLSNEEAQRLMDALWDAGLRPSEGSGSAGAMAATQMHLDDMRRLVFQGDK